AESRQAATSRLITALRVFPVLGIRTNIPFLLRVLTHERFRDGAIDTAFLDGEGAALAAAASAQIPPVVRAAVRARSSGAALATGSAGDAPVPDPWVRLDGWRAGMTDG